MLIFKLNFGKMIVQKLKPSIGNVYEMAEKYYSVITALNNINLTQRELQLVSFIASKGTIIDSGVKKEFCEEFGTTSPTVTNMISKIKKMNIFVKKDGILKINPVLNVKFDEDLLLEIKFVTKDEH